METSESVGSRIKDTIFCRRDVARIHYSTDTVVAPTPEARDCVRCCPSNPVLCCDLCLARMETEQGPKGWLAGSRA